jgi:hypothetical protein
MQKFVIPERSGQLLRFVESVVKRESKFGEHVKPGEAIQDTMGKANGGEAVEYPWSNIHCCVAPASGSG